MPSEVEAEGALELYCAHYGDANYANSISIPESNRPKTASNGRVVSALEPLSQAYVCAGASSIEMSILGFMTLGRGEGHGAPLYDKGLKLRAGDEGLLWLIAA